MDRNSPCRYWTRRGNVSKPLSGTGPVGARREWHACLTERGDCLRALGRLDQAAAAYEESIRRAEKLEDDRQVAVGKGQLGSVRMKQRRYPEALKAYEEARDRFTRLDEPGTVAASWHQIGMVHQAAGQPEAAEDAYRKSLAIEVRLGNFAGQADTLVQLGNLYESSSVAPKNPSLSTGKRPTNIWNHDAAKEGRARNGIAIALHVLRRWMKPERRSVARSNASRVLVTESNRGSSGSSSLISRRTLETPPPPPKRSARPSPVTSPTAATAARITTPMAASASP